MSNQKLNRRWLILLIILCGMSICCCLIPSFLPEDTTMQQPIPTFTMTPTRRMIPTFTSTPTRQPISTFTPWPTITAIPTWTPLPTQTTVPTIEPTSVPTVVPTPEPTAVPVEPTPEPTPVPICDCSYNRYNCSDFGTHRAAQACYEYCISQGAGDVHILDMDSDYIACEGLP